MQSPPRYLLLAWLALAALLAGNIALAFLEQGPVSLFINLAVAAMMAAIVLTLFMELRSSAGLLWVFAGAGFFWLSLLFCLTAVDYLTRYSFAPT